MRSTYGVTLHRSDHLTLDPHPDAPGADEWSAWVAGLRRPVAVDLFCGAGGLSLGLKQAGFEVVAAVDTDKYALATHRANFPGRAMKMDLADPAQVDNLVTLLSGITIDVLAGGPPCQPFSRAGRSKIRSLVAAGARPPVDDRRDLWQVFVEATERLRPSAVLFENVPDIALWNGSRIVRDMATSLEGAGYNVDYRLVDAWRYGVPQHRQRLILVAIRDGRPFDWPKSSGGRVTVKEAIGDLPSLEKGIGDRCLGYNGPSSKFQQIARSGMLDEANSLVWDHMTRPVRDDDREAFSLMTSETRYSDLPKRLRRYRTDIFNDKYKRLGWNDLSRTITAHIAKDGYWYIHPSEHRTLTVREAARLQTFPDRFRFEGTRSHAFAQIGNAVPPALATTISESLLNALLNKAPFPSYTGPKVRSATSKSQLPTVSATDRQRWFKRRILNWAPPGSDLWLRLCEPWSVLVSTICGRLGSGDSLAHRVLEIYPAPAPQSETSDQVHLLLGGSKLSDQRIRRSLRAADSIARYGWNSETWIKVAGLGPTDTRWVEAVGLNRYDLVTTTGTLRVAHRFNGKPEDTTAQTKVVLSRLVGTTKAIEVTVAMAALAAKVCTASTPRCEACPLVQWCRYAGGEENVSIQHKTINYQRS